MCNDDYVDFKELLDYLMRRIPPEGDQRHNITVYRGTLELSVFVDGSWVSFTLRQADFWQSAESLADKIVQEIQNDQN